MGGGFILCFNCLKTWQLDVNWTHNIGCDIYVGWSPPPQKKSVEKLVYLISMVIVPFIRLHGFSDFFFFYCPSSCIPIGQQSQTVKTYANNRHGSCSQSETQVPGKNLNKRSGWHLNCDSSFSAPLSGDWQSSDCHPGKCTDRHIITVHRRESIHHRNHLIPTGNN